MDDTKLPVVSAEGAIAPTPAGPESIPTERILRGRLALEIARFGTPLAVGMGLQTTFNLVDTYIIARLEQHVASASIAALGICDNLAALGTILSYGISIATGALISRRQGEGDEEGVRRIAWQSLLFVLALSAAFGLFAIVGAKVVMHDIVGAKGHVAELGTHYLRVMVGGSFSIFLLLHLITIQRALGSSKTPITMLVGANVINLVLAVLLVYGPDDAPSVFAWGPPIAKALGIPRLELMGAAWATVTARLLALVPTTYIVFRRFGLFGAADRVRPDPKALERIWAIGWPTSTQLVVRILAMIVTYSLVARAYTTEANQSATTALGIVFRLETMALFVGLGWGSASQTFMGQNLGAGELGRAKKSGWYAMLFNAVMMGALALVYVGYAERIARFFDAEPTVVDTAVHYLRWVAPSYVGLGIGIVLGSAIQGAGATRHTLLIDVLMTFGLQFPVCLLIVFGLQLDATRLWQALAAVYVVHAVVYTFSYKRGKYLHTALE